VDENLKKIINKIEKIPTLPHTITQIISIINNPNSSAEDVNRAISSDLSLASKVLKIVNSSYYGLSKKVSSITQAIVILGFNTIQSLAFSASVMDLFARQEHPKLRRVDFWEHCFSVALISKLIAKNLQVSIKEIENYFLGGLLHDIGKVVLDQYFNSDFNSIIELVEIQKLPMTEAEKTILGTTHSEIGRLVSERWKFPDILIEAIRYHHTPQFATINKKLVTIVYLSDFLCKAKHLGFSGDYYINNFQEPLVTQFNITPQLIKKLLTEDIDAELKKAESLLLIIKSMS